MMLQVSLYMCQFDGLFILENNKYRKKRKKKKSELAWSIIIDPFFYLPHLKYKDDKKTVDFFLHF